MRLIQIAACAQNRVIGRENTLPWNIPEDLRFFRETTKGHILILGRKTFESIGSAPLPQRFHIVVSRAEGPSLPQDRVVYVPNIEMAIEMARKEVATGRWGQDVFIAGGGEIYRQFLPFSDAIYLTQIHQVFQGDSYFPEIPSREFEIYERRDCSDPIPFSFLKYRRIPGQTGAPAHSI